MAFQNALTVGTDYSSTRNMTGTGTELDPWYVYEIQDFLDAVYTQGSYVVLGDDIDFKSSIEYRAGIPRTVTIKTRELYGRAYPYKSTKTYAVGDKVSYDNQTQYLEYTCIQNCTGVDPTDTDYWTSGDVSEYDPLAAYSVGEVCSFNNGIAEALYICIDSCTGINPNNTAHWEMKNFLDKKVSGLIGGNITGYSGSSLISATSSLSGTAGDLYIYNMWFKDMVFYSSNSSSNGIINADSSKNSYWYNCKYSGLIISTIGCGKIFGGNGTVNMYYCSAYFKYTRPTVKQNQQLREIYDSGNSETYLNDSFVIIDGLHCITSANNSTANLFRSINNSTIMLDLHVGRDSRYTYVNIPIFNTSRAWTDVIFICNPSYYKGDGGEQDTVFKFTHTSGTMTRVFVDSSLFGEDFELLDIYSSPVIPLTTEQMQDKDALAEYGFLVNEVVD